MNRKEMVKAIEVHFGVKAKYMGAPTFAYQIAIDGRTYTIDRIGLIVTEEGQDIRLDRLLNGDDEKDIVEKPTAEDKELSINQDELNTENKETEPQEPINIEVTIPMDGHTYISLRNIINMLYSKQILVKKVFEVEDDIVSENFIASINNTDIQSMEDFKSIVNQKQEHCSGIEFNFTDKSITFKFYNNPLNQDKLEAYTHLVAKLSETAKTLKYASPKPASTDNDRFTMRVWLIRLGFNGPEYKAIRKSILKCLSGNSAFKNITR